MGIELIEKLPAESKHREPDDKRVRPAPELADSCLAKSSAIADLPIGIADHTSSRKSAPTSNVFFMHESRATHLKKTTK